MGKGRMIDFSTMFVTVKKTSLLLLLPVFLLVFFSPLVAEAAAQCDFTVTNTNDSGGGSLRQAISEANWSSGTPTVCFAIGSGPQTIIPTSPLPPVTGPMVIDGSSQPGFAGTPLIQINGAGAGQTPGFWITAGNSTIKGLVINGFGANGIFISDNPGNIITGNYIGTDASGTAAVANGTDGVGIFHSSGHTVGGTTAGERNLVSGNAGNGIGITGADASANIIQGNYIGTNAAGTGSIANGGDGILLNDSPDNTIGGTTGASVGGACTGACNLISGNGYNGVGLWYANAAGNKVLGNYIGTNAAGTAALANFNIGVELNESPNNTVGGFTPESRNVMSGNGGAGMLLTGSACTGNVVAGNFIGTNAAGTGGVGNQKMGISIAWSPGIYSANNNLIGGTTGVSVGGACTGACNLISGNHDDGVFITNNGGGGANQLKGNYIGTNAAGTGSIGNGANGIGILDVANNQVGGSSEAERNVISGNGDNGIIVVGWASTGNRIEGNYIGRAGNGGNLGNTSFGVLIASGTDTAILGNGIYANGLHGIDLGYNFVTPNDPNDPDGGANRSQNFPVVTAAHTSGGSTAVNASINSMPGTSFRIDFFSCQYCNAGPPNDYGEGQVFLGSKTVTTDVYGNVSFTYISSIQVQGGQFVTATATKMIGTIAAETSEFSRCRQVTGSVDTVPPAVSVPSPTGGSLASGSVIFTADAWDNVAVKQVELYIDNSLVATDSTYPYTCQWDTTAYSQGDHVLKAVAEDKAGLTAEAATTVTVDNFTASNNYYFTWYDQSSGDWRDWVLMANPSTGTGPARSSVQVGSTTYADRNIGVGDPAETPSFPGVIGGPVTVATDAPLITSQRVLYKDSFNEMTAVPENQLEHEYYFTWYDLASPSMKGNWIMVSNQEVSAADVEIYIGGVLKGSYTIPAGGRITPDFPGVIGGPVRITCPACAPTHKLMASQRVLFNNAFNEVAAVPGSSLGSEYLFTWYDCLRGNGMAGNWILVSNQDAGDADVEIYIGGVLKGSYTIPEGGIIKPQFAGQIGGPVRVVSTNGKQLLVSQRIIYKDSFEEVQGLAPTDAGTDLWFTWYDSRPQNSMNGNWILVSNQGGGDAAVDVYIDGALKQQLTLAAGENRPLSYVDTIGGPVRVVSTNGQPLLATQRVIYKNSFNEVAGITY